MKNNQLKFIEYIESFSEKNLVHIWLGGSFLNGNSTIYSDVDISVYGDVECIKKLIYGYGNPAYISYTHKPFGILVIIYEDGVAVDLEIVEKINFESGGYFHREDIKQFDYLRNDKMCMELVLKNDEAHQVSRQLHRSLIKFLVGKKDIAMRTVNEVASFCKMKTIEESDYKNGYVKLLDRFKENYPISQGFENVLCELFDEIKN